MRFTAGMTMVPVVLQSCPFLCKQVDPVRVLYLDRLNPSDYNRLPNIRRFARLVFGAYRRVVEGDAIRKRSQVYEHDANKPTHKI